MQAPPTRDPLQPAADSALNYRSSTPSISRKRGRDEDEHTDTFTAKSIDTKAKPSSVTFASILLVPRSNIPLIWLAPAASYKTLASPYLFETSLSPTWQHEGCALVARLLPNGGLYAVERASHKTWVGCRLSGWVTEEHCRDAADGQLRLLDHDGAVSRKKHARSDSQSTTTSGRPITPCSPKKPNNRRGALARMSILSSAEPHDQKPAPQQETRDLVESPCNETLLSSEPSNTAQSRITTREPMPLSQEHIVDATPTNGTERTSFEPTMPSVETPIPEQPRRDHLSVEHVVQQYLDTLYLSRTSLAFYAKGPLSRARAMANSGDGDLDVKGLAEIYRSCITPSKKCELKYKESLIGAVKALATTETSAEGSKAKKKRASLKLKLGKDGLYGCETDFIEKWWHGRELTSNTVLSTNAMEAELNRSVSDLRTRETQMQVLLILEVMALELTACKSVELRAEAVDTAVKTEATDEDVSKLLANTPKVKKKPRDFRGELDALVDKLCIWHTVSLGDILSLPEKDCDDCDASTKSKDKLKEFWVEVIKPFYGAKLPEQTKSLCRKLGAADASPQRTRPLSAKSRSHVNLAQSMKFKTSARTLERVLSEDTSLRHASPPALSRSSTVPDTKREPSIFKMRLEPSDVSARPASRTGMRKSVSFVGREIDLIAQAKVHDVKKRKLDKINTQQNELKAAIEALKKPNRGDVARAIMDEAEQRKAVQITATPGRRKTAHLLSSGQDFLSVDGDEVSFEEINPVIPSSTIKPLLMPIARCSTQKKAVLVAIHDTPSRSLSRTSNPLQLPTEGSRDSIIATPARSRLRPGLSLDQIETPVPKMRNSGRAVLFTPLRRTDVSVQDAFKDAPMIPEEAGKAMDRVMGGKGVGEDIGLDASMSIYDQLGWNDDDQDL